MRRTDVCRKPDAMAIFAFLQEFPRTGRGKADDARGKSDADWGLRLTLQADGPGSCCGIRPSPTVYHQNCHAKFEDPCPVCGGVSAWLRFCGSRETRL